MEGVKQTEILLEPGTNELEIMEFTIGDELFGINVGKVVEIMRIMPVKPMQKAHPNIEGVFKPRDKVLTVIDLAGYLKLPPSEHPERDIFLVTKFNGLEFSFHVHTVVGIDRISWTQMKKTDKLIYGEHEGVATAIAEHDGRLITILDFEKIVTEITDSGIRVSDVDKIGDRITQDKPILIAEDSMMLAKLLIESLNRAGYNNTFRVNNGQEAWNYLSELKESDESIENNVACIITDIEMPQMDGLHLTKLVKEDQILKDLPVVLFSSLISDEMKKKGEQVGADEQISKPEIVRLVQVLDRIIQ